MRDCRNLILLLAVVLVFQGVAAGAPHHHSPGCSDDQVMVAPSDVESPHHCLACSVHAAVAVAASTSSTLDGSDRGCRVVIDGNDSAAVPETSFFDPRGPPSAV